jgi:A/G-specific adenine glycosylase
MAWLSQAPGRASWRRLAGTVGHTFTHFHLELALFVAERPVAAHDLPGEARWVAPADLGQEALPSLMRKLLKRSLAEAAQSGSISRGPTETKPRRR